MRCRICELRFYFSLSLPISPNGLYQVHKRLYIESYTPRTWRTHPLHLIPPEPYSQSNPQATQCLNWIFLISSLNFSFWSEREGYNDRFGVEWRTGWGEERRTVHTGYWSLVAAIDRGLPLITFFSSKCIQYFLLLNYSARGRHLDNGSFFLCVRGFMSGCSHIPYLSPCLPVQRIYTSVERTNSCLAGGWRHSAHCGFFGVPLHHSIGLMNKFHFVAIRWFFSNIYRTVPKGAPRPRDGPTTRQENH